MIQRSVDALNVKKLTHFILPVMNRDAGMMPLWVLQQNQVIGILAGSITRYTRQRKASFMIKAPFTKEQVERLNWYQKESGWHPFTCGTPGCYETIAIGDRSFKQSTELIATEAGWICNQCGYTQDWAHESMLDLRLKSPMEIIKEQLK